MLKVVEMVEVMVTIILLKMYNMHHGKPCDGKTM